ncbi:hypothetical protein [Aestuariivirga sp.]|uniref:hypothetical protein n=1 Tax=Aestuariivirga sp. TaxID=2650926 RepID=UPI003592ECF0
MKRYTFFVLIVLGSAASAIAAIAPTQRTGLGAEAIGRNVTVIEKNQAFPLVGPLVVEDCLTDDCSESRG